MRTASGSRSVVVALAASAMGLIALGFADRALAQTTVVAGGNPANIVVGIPVTASIGGSCGFSTAPNDSHSVPDLDTGFTKDTGFVLNCNGASRLAVVSANGGLKSSAPAVGGYSNLAPYTVAVRMNGNGGVFSEDNCPVASLSASAPAPCAFRGPVMPSVGLELNGPSNGQAGSYVRVSAPVYSGTDTLVASTAYSDTLTVTLSASI